MRWIEDQIDQHKGADEVSINLGISDHNGKWVEWPNDPDRRREHPMRCTTYTCQWFRLC